MLKLRIFLIGNDNDVSHGKTKKKAMFFLLVYVDFLDFFGILSLANDVTIKKTPKL